MENKLEILKDKVLFDLISYISIIDVDVKVNFDSSINLYIKTSDLGTVEFDKVKELEKKFTDKYYSVFIMIPDEIQVSGDVFKKNTDTVCVYLDFI